MKKAAFVFVLAFFLPVPGFAQTTCADAYALCASPCGNSKTQTPERCMQTCQGKRNACMTNGSFDTGFQSFKGLQRVLEESPAISAWDNRSEPQTLKKDGAAQSTRRGAR